MGEIVSSDALAWARDLAIIQSLTAPTPREKPGKGLKQSLSLRAPAHDGIDVRAEQQGVVLLMRASPQG